MAGLKTPLPHPLSYGAEITTTAGFRAPPPFNFMGAQASVQAGFKFPLPWGNIGGGAAGDAVEWIIRARRRGRR